MNEKTLVKVSLACSIIGIIALFFLSESIEISDSTIGQIDIGMIGNDVSVEGVVNRVTNAEKVIIMDIADTNNDENKLTIVAFKKNSDDNINLKNNDKVKITGKIEEYNGKPEIIASEIRIVSSQQYNNR